MGKRSKNAFSVEQSPLVKVTRSSSCASNAHDDREKESKISNEDDFFTHTKGGRFFFYFGPFVLFSTMLVCPSFPPQEEKEKILSRERDVAAEKRERFSFLVETSRTQIKHASSHITTGVLSSLRFNDTFLRHHFSFQRYSDKRNNVVSFCSFFSRRGLHVFLVAS